MRRTVADSRFMVLFPNSLRIQTLRNPPSLEQPLLLKQVEEGKLTAKEYETELDKAVDEANKAIEAGNKEFNEMNAELRQKFPGHWSYDWDDPYRRVRTDFRG